MKIVGSGTIIRDKRVLLVKRIHTKKDYPNHWCFPGGGGEIGETPEETAVREVKEESGLDFINYSLFDERKTDTHHFFRFIGDGKGKVITQEEECDGYGWYTYRECEILLMHEAIREIIDKLCSKGLL